MDKSFFKKAVLISGLKSKPNICTQMFKEINFTAVKQKENYEDSESLPSKSFQTNVSVIMWCIYSYTKEST